MLRGEKPVNPLVEVRTKSELVINLKAANTIGHGVPQTLLSTADEEIE